MVGPNTLMPNAVFVALLLQADHDPLLGHW
jgi:hypothetical protein